MTAVIEAPADRDTTLGLSDLGWGSPDGPRGPNPHRKRNRRVALASLLVLVLVFAATATTFVVVQARLAGQVDRIDGVFTGLEHRPARASGAAGEALNILVMGTDRRSEEPTTGTDARAEEWIPGAQRTDTIMVLHVDADRSGASLVSIPRDAWVEVPGHGMAKVNAAFSLEGPALAVETVEELTGVRIDHLAVVDWEGLEQITDTLGGVTLSVPRTIEDPANHVVWTRGRQTLTGAQALLYVRQRYGLPNGDLDRVRRQQSYLLGLMRAGMRRLGSHSPMGVYELLDTLTRHVSVDREWSVGDMRGLLMDLRDIKGSDLDLLTAPVSGLGYVGDQSVVHLDAAANAELWEAVRTDRVDAWTAEHPDASARRPVS